MDPEDRDRLHVELVEAMFHPPKLIACGQRLSAARSVTVLSHIERWSWRTVVSGSRSATDDVGTRAVGGAHRLGWFSGWTLADDLNTEYRLTNASEHGNGFCMDFRVQFDGAVPNDASLLTLGFPSGRRVDVPIRGPQGSN